MYLSIYLSVQLHCLLIPYFLKFYFYFSSVPALGKKGLSPWEHEMHCSVFYLQ